MADQRTDRLVGTVLDGRFRLDDVLGSGGMGKVYSGIQLSVDRRVAVKVLREELSESHTLTQRFFREAKVVASLRHPNIVGLVDFGRDEELGLLYIAMEYVDGVSLARLLRRGRLEPALAVGIARQVCSALAEAHAAGVIHRDLKPDNVMLVTTAEGALSVKVLDFGIALPTGEEARLTSTGAVVGTPHYMAPEQAQDRPITERSDIYSLGVLVYEMLTGRLPFVAETPMAVLLKVITQPPPPIGEVLQPDAMPPADLIALMTAMLSKEPAGRPPDIAAVGARLDEVTRAHGFVTPTVSTPRELDDLVVERASDEFVYAPTAASPVPTPSSSAAVPPVSTAEDRAVGPGAQVAALDPPKKKPWVWFIAPLLFIGCCCLPLVNSWIENAARQPPGPGGPEEIDLGSADVGSSVETTDDGGGATPPVRDPWGEDAGAAVLGVRPNPPTPPRLPETENGPSVVEEDGTVLGGSRGGTCGGKNRCNYTDGLVGCSADSHCTADCSSGGCSQHAVDRATAEFECGGGGCTQRCMGDANCKLKCSGGGCTQMCLTNGRCKRTCDGKGCTRQ